MSVSAPEPPVRRPTLDWDRDGVAVRDPAEPSKVVPGRSVRPPSGLARRVRRLARFLYRLLTENP